MVHHVKQCVTYFHRRRNDILSYWLAGTDIRLMKVLNPSLLLAINTSSLPIERPSFSSSEEANGRIESILDSYVEIARQNASDASVSKMLVTGDPKRVLVDEAERWGADCIFIGSRGLNRWERLLFGSVSTAVAARARCPVEVVRVAHPLS
jgi:nucleotide-binding universal stress UspA family protein